MKRYWPEYSSIGPCMQEETEGGYVRQADAAERIATLEAENTELRRIKEAADVLYSEAEEYDFDSGLGMGAGQQYWDDLANALFSDDSAEVIVADLERIQAEAWGRFNEELNRPEFLPCGHHHSLMLKSAETGEPLYCEYCDCINMRNDFEAQLTELTIESEGTIMALSAEVERLRGLFSGIVCRNIAFSWNGPEQCHTPWIRIDFADVPAGQPNDAQGWRDRDAFAAAIDAALAAKEQT